jgi:hypothetical protein
MSAAPADDDETSQQPDGPADHFLSHRRLIRATLPRTEADLPPARPIPEFTMHQRPFNRSGHRHGWHGGGNGSANGSGNGNVNGNVHGNGNGNGGVRQQHGRGPGPGGQGQGQGHGHPRRHRGGKQHRPR